jgi:hypothetical protein
MFPNTSIEPTRPARSLGFHVILVLGWPDRLSRDRWVATVGDARSIQFHAGRREDHSPEVRLAVVAQSATSGRQGLDRQRDECGILQEGR